MKKITSLKDFQILAKLGEGAFAEVYKVKRRQDDQIYAMKKIKLNRMKERDRENALNQVRILASYDREYIIGFKQAFFDQLSSCLCIIMEYASAGDVLKIVQRNLKEKTRINQQQIWKALVHITLGLKSMHERKILHRDLKCANIFVDENGTYKLGDLNVSKVLKTDLAVTQTGTPYYTSPQVWKDQPYDLKSDMWSLGCVLYQMAALRPPFIANDLQGLYKKICGGYYQRIPIEYSNELMSVINSLLKINPNERPTADSLLMSSIVQKRNKIAICYLPVLDNNILLDTIKLNNRNLKHINQLLPAPKYQCKSSRDRNASLDRICPQSMKFISKKSQEKVSISLKKSIEKKKKVSSKQIINQYFQFQILKNSSKESIEKLESNRRYKIVSVGEQQKKIGQNNILVSKNRNKQKQIEQIDNLIKPYIGSNNVVNQEVKLPPLAKLNNKNSESIKMYLPPLKDYSIQKQNLRKIGQNIIHGQKYINRSQNYSNISSARIVRINSIKKIVQPDWMKD